eukprot:gnl/TRDRNA2_/TRDRNA2_176085_c0_seq3.p1 gnl/TRDRNA2_/TRDRNA2_176085_c0~~gnl/TRDRNA2_/TRDRNA2_176085_c0_seq3.p1  ORF type:complete len:617 (+),score=117.26 gnl/TRDRNA2_/TRDRNA2_176085_c0_seq3:121-1851(+)
MSVKAYQKDCFQTRPVSQAAGSSSLSQQSKKPGAGIDKFDPYKVVFKDGYTLTTCIKDELLHYGDKFGANKHEYTMGSVANVSIVRYKDHVVKEDRHAMTPDVCFRFCRTVPDMLFFGIQNGYDCYCAPYYKPMASDSSHCDATCPGKPTSFCGGKVKSSIFEMHFCDDTVAELKTARKSARAMANRIRSIEAREAKITGKMINAAEVGLKVFSKAGDLAASDMMQLAKVHAGDQEQLLPKIKAVRVRLLDFVDELSTHIPVLKKEGPKPPKILTKAERILTSIRKAEEEGKQYVMSLENLVATRMPVPSSPAADASKVKVTIHIRAGAAPEENSFDIDGGQKYPLTPYEDPWEGDGDGDDYEIGRDYYYPMELAEGEHRINMYDSYGDGWDWKAFWSVLPGHVTSAAGVKVLAGGEPEDPGASLSPFFTGHESHAIFTIGKSSNADALRQYRPVMYFVDKEFQNVPQTCSGDLATEPILTTNKNECALACDAEPHTCVGFALFPDAGKKPRLCFLFSNFKSAMYYTGCAKPAEDMVTCYAKFMDFQGLNLAPQDDGQCKHCLKELTKADRCFDYK